MHSWTNAGNIQRFQWLWLCVVPRSLPTRCAQLLDGHLDDPLAHRRSGRDRRNGVISSQHEPLGKKSGGEQVARQKEILPEEESSSPLLSVNRLSLTAKRVHTALPHY